MGNFKIGLMLVCFSYFQVMVVLCQGPLPINIWFQNLKILPLPKFAVIELYDQDVLAGSGETSYEIARSNISSTSPTSFGRLLMVDNQLTSGPELSSPVVGRNQGLVGSADLNEIGYYLSFNLVFQGGQYDGSTISVLGRSRLLDSERELSIVGGTGDFRLAKGVVQTSTYTLNTTGDTIFKYTLYITYI